MKNEKNYVIIAAIEGFYLFGEEIQGAGGNVVITNASMIYEFNTEKGIASVHRGDKGATVTLNRYSSDAKITLPISSVVMIMENCVDLYEFKGTKLI